jgi:thiamine pyrophosphokinase
VLVGDLDSAAPRDVRAAEAAGVHVERHPADKSERLDHHLAELLLLGSQRFAGLRLDARIGSARVVPVHAPEGVALAGAPGAILTLLALGGAATGIVTTGLRWPLRAETLHAGSTRGVSNEIVSGPVRVELAAGTLLAVGTLPLERAG